MPSGDTEASGDGINPFGRAFDLGEITDGSFVNDHVAPAIVPLATKFLVGKAGLESASSQDVGQCLAVFDRGLDFPARLMPAGLWVALVFVGDRPLHTVLANAQQRA